MRVTVNTSGNVVSYDDYYPFGALMYGRSQDSSSVDGRYKYTGKERDDETKYDYFGARYYDARIGRWLSVDPSNENTLSISPYVYGRNNPLVFIDPHGRQEYKITVRTFIPFKMVVPFRGDARGSMLEGGTYRTEQVVSVQTGRNGIIKSHKHSTGVTKGNFPIPSGITTGIMVQEVESQGYGHFAVEASKGNGTEVQLTGEANNPLLPFNTPISYDITIKISESGEPIISSAIHKGFPAHEVYVQDEEGNIVESYTYMPRSVLDVRKLFVSPSQHIDDEDKEEREEIKGR